MLGNAEAFRILGLQLGASKKEVKAAFRKKALATHPDLNPSPAAAAEYARIQEAANYILNEAGQHSRNASAGTRAPYRPSVVERIVRLPKFPLYFSAVSVLGGCVIFYGALQAHHAVFDGYSYDIVSEAQRRKDNPTPAQQRIQALLMQKQQEDALRK